MDDICLKNLFSFSKQDIFSTVAKRLIEQNAKSTALDCDDYLVCRYRGDNGLKCAVGHLIADDEYNPQMESTTAWCAVAMFYDAHRERDYKEVISNKIGIGKSHIDEVMQLLCTLQELHDHSEVTDWHVNLEQVALERGFTL